MRTSKLQHPQWDIEPFGTEGLKRRRDVIESLKRGKKPAIQHEGHQQFRLERNPAESILMDEILNVTRGAGPGQIKLMFKVPKRAPRHIGKPDRLMDQMPHRMNQNAFG